MTRIYVFPGHGSQSVGIGQDLFARYPDLVREADSVLGYSIEELCLRGPAERLSDNRFTQPAMYVVGALSYLDHVADSGHLPDVVAGHSLGEYVALFAAGVFDFRTGLEIVDRRAELMNAEATGAVIAVIGLHPRRIRELLDLHSCTAVDFSGLNSPEQTALSGPGKNCRMRPRSSAGKLRPSSGSPGPARRTPGTWSPPPGSSGTPWPRTRCGRPSSRSCPTSPRSRTRERTRSPTCWCGS